MEVPASVPGWCKRNLRPSRSRNQHSNGKPKITECTYSRSAALPSRWSAGSAGGATRLEHVLPWSVVFIGSAGSDGKTTLGQSTSVALLDLGRIHAASYRWISGGYSRIRRVALSEALGWPPLIQHQRPLQYARPYTRPTTSAASKSCEAQEPGTCLRERGNDL